MQQFSKSGEKIIYVVIVLNLISMVFESEPDLSLEQVKYLNYFELFSISIFSIEYILRTFISIKNKRNYNSSFFGIIDLIACLFVFNNICDFIAILPFFFQSFIGFDGRFVRVFRLFRVSRILKLGKFNRSFELLWNGIKNVQRELYLTFFIAFVMLFFSATGIYYLENELQPESFTSIRASFWWAVASLTGVGFEEIYPITLGGKIFGTIISLVGVGVVAVPTGIISASFVEVITNDKKF